MRALVENARFGATVSSFAKVTVCARDIRQGASFLPGYDNDDDGPAPMTRGVIHTLIDPVVALSNDSSFENASKPTLSKLIYRSRREKFSSPSEASRSLWRGEHVYSALRYLLDKVLAAPDQASTLLAALCRDRAETEQDNGANDAERQFLYRRLRHVLNLMRAQNPERAYLSVPLLSAFATIFGVELVIADVQAELLQIESKHPAEMHACLDYLNFVRFYSVLDFLDARASDCVGSDQMLALFVSAVRGLPLERPSLFENRLITLQITVGSLLQKCRNAHEMIRVHEMADILEEKRRIIFQ